LSLYYEKMFYILLDNHACMHALKGINMVHYSSQVYKLNPVIVRVYGIYPELVLRGQSAFFSLSLGRENIQESRTTELWEKK